MTDTPSTSAPLPDYRGIFHVNGKVAVVTGACGILGRHFCAALASHGAKVAVIDLDQAATDALATQLREQFGNDAIGIACDVSQSDSVKAMTAKVVRHFGHIDVLHNNAATKSSSLQKLFARFEDYSEDTWRECMAVNIDGMFLVAREVGKQMVSQGSGGSIIQTSSIYGIMGPDQRIYEGSLYMGGPINSPGVYSAAKAAVIGLTKYLATNWGDQNIRVNAIVPGGVESGQNDTFKQRYSARIPLGRMAQASEMVGAVVWLASDASSYVTGQQIVVDGGLSAW